MTGSDLQAWRKRMGWTQKQAAEELRVTSRTYQRAEAAQPSPTMARLATHIEREKIGA